MWKSGLDPDSCKSDEDSAEKGEGIIECIEDIPGDDIAKKDTLHLDVTNSTPVHGATDERTHTTLLRTQVPQYPTMYNDGDIFFISDAKVSAQNKTQEPPASYESSYMVNNDRGITTERPQSEQTRPQIETLDRIAKKLIEYVPRDELDQDNIISVISKMNMDAFLRHKRRDLLRNSKGSIARSSARDDDECYWNDDDIIQARMHDSSYLPNTKHLDALINVVDEMFFDTIIEKVEDDSIDYILDEETIKKLRDSLVIKRDLNKKRKRRNLRVAASSLTAGNTSNSDGSDDILKSSKMAEDDGNEKKRITRGMTRDTNNKDNENEGLEALLAAMIGLERAAGKPIDIIGEIATPSRLRSRNKLKSTHVQKVQNDDSNNCIAKSKPKVSEDESQKLFAQIELSPDIKQQGAKKRVRYPVQVTKITVGGKEFQSPRKASKRKRKGVVEGKGKKQKEGNAEDNAQFSLNLLDWGNNNLPLKSNPKAKRSLPMNGKKTRREIVQQNELSPAAIDAILASWDAIDGIGGVSDDPASLEPPRKRHSDERYGSLCSELVNSLQGSARVFARHEFFYSDIDKAWFNENRFHSDLVRNGIDPITTKLTRKEWSAIRRKIRKRQRRFTRAFIDSEFRSLNKYRKVVRQIQWAIHSTNNPPVLAEPFDYQVLAPPQIGTICTAYHHKTHLLHRGLVLAHDYRTEAYLVQFEKKALGYEWCADFEVASHGLPRVIYPPTKPNFEHNEMTLKLTPYGTIPSGTCYGPLIEFYNKETQGLNKPIDVPAVGDMIHLKRDIGKLMERVAEREALVKLMCMIEIILERKESILEAMTACNTTYKNVKESGKDPTLLPNFAEFKANYSCLHKNLKLNQKALEVAMAQLQIIYGEAYTGFAASTENDRDGRHEDQTNDGHISHNKDKSWHRHMDEQVLDISEEIAFKVVSDETASTSNQYTSSMVSSAGSLLLTSDLIMKLREKIKASEHKRNEILNKTCIQAAFWNQLNLLEPAPIQNIPRELNGILQARESAFESLVESVSMLAAEMALQAEKI